jgi:hypothetical protein
MHKILMDRAFALWAKDGCFDPNNPKIIAGWERSTLREKYIVQAALELLAQ